VAARHGRPSSTRSNPAHGVTRAQAAAWAWAGKAASRATPLGPHSAREAKARSWPSDQIPRPSAAPPPPRRNKTRRPAETLSHFLLPLSLSCERRRPRGRRPWRPRRSDEAAPPWLARRRVRSPLGERAIVELAVDGASLWSQRACVPAASGGPVPASRRLCRAAKVGGGVRR
jgi:hypothetical protein